MFLPFITILTENGTTHCFCSINSQKVHKKLHTKKQKCFSQKPRQTSNRHAIVSRVKNNLFIVLYRSPKLWTMDITPYKYISVQFRYYFHFAIVSFCCWADYCFLLLKLFEWPLCFLLLFHLIQYLPNIPIMRYF